MARAHAGRTRPHPSPLPEGEGVRHAWLTDFSLYMSIALVLARAMMLEILREPVQVEMGQESIPRGPGPAAGLVLNLLCCVPVLLVLMRAMLDRGYIIHRSLAHLFMAMLSIWTLASPIWASDKFSATVNAAHFATGLVMLWTFSQLVRDWLQLRLVAAAALGLMLVLTAQGLIYKYVDLPELKQDVERRWDQIIAERGWEPGSFIEEQFKKRILGGEVMGFSASPNTLGAMLVMLGIVSAGLMLQRIRDGDEYGWAVVIGLAMLPVVWVLWLTGSRTALATPILAAVILVIAWNTRSWIVAHPKLVFFGSVLLILLCIATVVGHGMRHGSLFHDSLTFRWKYWVGSWPIVVTYPLIGVGFANFGLYYLGTRLPEAAEEINDPHNFMVRIFVELGLTGGVILIAWLLRLWWELSSPSPSNDRGLAQPRPERTVGQAVAPLIWLAATAGAVGILAAVDFSQSWHYSFIEVLKRTLYVFLLLLGLTVGTLRSTAHPEPDGRPAPWLLCAMLVALAIFLVHNLVDFSLFETGAMLSFMMLAGSVLGIRLGGEPRPIPRRWTISFGVVALVVWMTAGIALVAPIVIAEHHADRGDAALRAGRPASAARSFQRAFNILWIPNPDYAFRAARAMVLAGHSPDQIRATIKAAMRASYMSPQYPRLLAEFEMRQPTPVPDAAIPAFSRVLAIDPMDITTRLDLAQAFEQFNMPAEARAEYEEALRLNDLLDPAEPERLSSARIAQIERKIALLQPP